MDAGYYRSEHLTQVQKVLEQYGYKDTLHFFAELGLRAKSRNGYLYPLCNQASSVLAVLMNEIHRLGAEVHTDIHVTDVRHKENGFQIMTESKSFSVDKVILAAGGKAAPVLGSDGSGYQIAKSLGHTLVPVVPALVQLKVKDTPLKKAAGVRVEAEVSAYVGNEKIASDTGEVQLTAYGISGIPVFQISRFIARGLYENQKTFVSADFLPDMSEDAYIQFLKNRREKQEHLEMTECLAGIFNSKLIPELLKIAKIQPRKWIEKLSEDDLKRFAKVCKGLKLPVTDTNGFDNAQVCAGGVPLTEIDCETMESCCQKGLYLAGELLDADGLCGGYNLQWAWSTGYIAGRNAAKERSGANDIR